MSKEREYLEHKKSTIINIVKNFNDYNNYYQIRINKKNLDIEKMCCSSKSICSQCGECCQRGPCAYSPNDFLDITDLDYMRKILNTGVVCIVKRNNLYPLIIRNRGVYDSETISCVHPDTYNQCILLTKNGCMLPDVYRGSEGLLYIRKKSGHIIIYGSGARGYYYEYNNPAYQESLQILYDEYFDVKIPKKSINEERVNEFVKCLINK